MKNYKRYSRPYSQMTSTALSMGGKRCPAVYHVWKCTRERGHGGRHEAGGMRAQMYASWEED